MRLIRIGTRGSPLALWQAHHVAQRIAALSAEVAVDIAIIKTRGDEALSARRYGTLEKGLFTTEIEDALRAASIDLAVHSLKDLPTRLADGLTLAAIPVREDPADALVAKGNATLESLPPGAMVLSGSLRRRGQLLHRRSDLNVQPARGNVQTRLRKLDEGPAAATVLACAGLVRSGLENRISERLDPAVFLPACGQGALAIETRSDDAALIEFLSALEHAPTRWAVTAERAMLTALGGGCQIPVGAYARFEGPSGMMVLTAMACELDGQRLLRETLAAPVSDVASAEALGGKLGQVLTGLGCGEILARAAAQLKAENGL
ncbi:MAG: hydroxymethylbilane synthase [Planctomycetaceae bacterium]|nr:hydroxymethylbilane synthase [Planctomycetaceae bacterium]